MEALSGFNPWATRRPFPNPRSGQGALETTPYHSLATETGLVGCLDRCSFCNFFYIFPLGPFDLNDLSAPGVSKRRFDGDRCTSPVNHNHFERHPFVFLFLFGQTFRIIFGGQKTHQSTGFSHGFCQQELPSAWAKIAQQKGQSSNARPQGGATRVARMELGKLEVMFFFHVFSYFVYSILFDVHVCLGFLFFFDVHYVSR